MTQHKPVVLVTGVSGLIGSAFVEDLAKDYRIVGLDVAKPDPRVEDSLDWFECDLTDDASTSAALDKVKQKHGARLASVVHLAAYYDFSGEPSPLYQKLTVEGTARLLRKLQELEVQQFVFSSSLLVMKPVEPGETLTESSATEAEWDYPQSKLDAEQAIANERGDIPGVSLRIAGIYDERCHSLPIAQQIRRIFEKQLESHFFPGKEEHGQSFLHLEDLVRLVRHVIERRDALKGYEVFLVGEPDVVSYGELQDRFGELIHGKEWTTIRVPKPMAKAGAWMKDKVTDEEAFIQPWMVDIADAHYPVSIAKAERQLEWSPRHRLRDVLPKMVEHLLEDPKRWYEENGLPWPEDEGEQRELVETARSQSSG